MKAARIESSSASVGSSADGRPFKTLSRNALYTPLMAYEQTTVEPAKFMGDQQSIPKAIHESTLTTFLQSISEDYHRTRAVGADPKNNGSRPLSISDVDERIRQRVVSMVGGGVNSAMASSKKKPVVVETCRSRKRPRREWNHVQKLLAITSKTSADSISFLRNLNTKWNDYIFKVLEIKGKEPSHLDATSIKARLVMSRASIELCGAHMQVRSCHQKRNLVGASGVVIGETTNTWSVAMMIRSDRKQKRPTKKRSKSGDNRPKDSEIKGDSKSSMEKDASRTEIVCIPKRGTSMDIIIPLSRKGDEIDDQRQSTDSIIQPVSPSIFVTFAGN